MLKTILRREEGVCYKHENERHSVTENVPQKCD